MDIVKAHGAQIPALGFGVFRMSDAEVEAVVPAALEAGFRHLDLTSFVSPKWVPQHADAEAVLAELPPPQGREYLVIVANEKGMERALAAPSADAKTASRAKAAAKSPKAAPRGRAAGKPGGAATRR